MIAYVENGEVQCSAILHPALHELYHADATGAYRNGEKISVSKVDKLSSSLINIATYTLNRLFDDITEFQNVSTTLGVTIDMYTAAYILTACASGKIE